MWKVVLVNSKVGTFINTILSDNCDEILGNKTLYDIGFRLGEIIVAHRMICGSDILDGEYKLPDNTLVMAAGNRTTDRAVAYKMPSALANRMMHCVSKRRMGFGVE